jgi:hypothetical protein
MSDTKYNGWTNYATWRVNLEIFDGFDPREHFTLATDDDSWLEDLAENLKAFAEEMIISPQNNGLCQDYALAFLSYVNWHEIAQHMISDYVEI